MKFLRRIYPLIMTSMLTLTTLFGPHSAKADLFGGDVAVLAQILSNAIQQLATLKQMMDIAKGDADLLKRVNRDIEQALAEINAIQDLVRDTNEIGKTKDPVELLYRLRNIYGRIPRIGNIKGLEFADNVSGSGLGVDNDSHVHAQKLDNIAQRLQQQSRTASPGRAAQITAQSQSAIIHSLAQIERNGGTVARIAATDLAMENTKEKNRIESFDEGYASMTTSKATVKSDLVLGSL